MSTSAGWVKFFKDAGIPSDLSAKYAVMFTDHRIQKGMLADLDRDILSDIGITAVGDKMAILKHARFTVEQAKRDTSSKLLADGIKTLESRTNKPSSPAARMITHGIKSRSSPGRNSPKSSSGDESSKSTKSVFERLGQDSPAKKSGVFSRLGNETQESKELPYAGVLKRSSPTATKKNILVSGKSKSTSVLDRLGAEKHSDDNEIPDSSTQIRKAPASNIIRLKKSVMLTKNVTIKQAKPKLITSTVITPNSGIKRTSNVLDRLGDIVTSTTKQSLSCETDSTNSPKKTSMKPKLIIRVPKKSPKVTLKRKSTGDLEAIAQKRPISSNKVSSTSSAGIFKGAAVASSSVFARLGRK